MCWLDIGYSTPPLLYFVRCTSGPTSSLSAEETRQYDTFSRVAQLRLSNGIRINYRRTDNEPNGCLLRMICNGGRAAEKMGIGPDGFGAVSVGECS